MPTKKLSSTEIPASRSTLLERAFTETKKATRLRLLRMMRKQSTRLRTGNMMEKIINKTRRKLLRRLQSKKMKTL